MQLTREKEHVLLFSIMSTLAWWLNHDGWRLPKDLLNCWADPVWAFHHRDQGLDLGLDRSGCGGKWSEGGERCLDPSAAVHTRTPPLPKTHMHRSYIQRQRGQETGINPEIAELGIVLNSHNILIRPSNGYSALKIQGGKTIWKTHSLSSWLLPCLGTSALWAEADLMSAALNWLGGSAMPSER